MSKGRRIKPSTKEGRRRKIELGQIIASPRTSKAEREAAIRELDILAPVEGSGTPIKNEDSRPLTRDLLALCDRVETRRDGTPSEKSIPSSGTPVSADPVDAGRKGLARQLDAAKRALEPQLKAKTLHIDDALCTIAEAHAKFGYEIWTGRRDWEEIPREGKAAIVTCQIKHWRGEPVFDKPTWGNAAWDYFMQLPAVEKLKARGAFEQFKAGTTPESRKKIFEQLKIAERMEKPMPERYWTEPPAASPAVEASKPAPMNAEPEAALNPIARAGADLASRAALVLQTDSWLSRLSEHSEDMRNRIIASLSDELLRAGCVSGDFCARTYNSLRPKSVAAFQERRF